MGLIEDKIVSSQSDQLTTVTELLIKRDVSKDSEILTVIIGQDAEQAVTDNMYDKLDEEQYPDVEWKLVKVDN